MPHENAHLSDPRQKLTTVDVVALLNVVAQAMGRARRPASRARLTALRVKLQAIGQYDAEVINSADRASPGPTESDRRPSYAALKRVAEQVRDACAVAEGFESYTASDWGVAINPIVDAAYNDACRATESDRRDTERLDAARYRFLRERMEIRSEATLLGHFARCVSVQIGRSRIGALRDACQQCERDDAFDAAIDAAMSSVGSSNATEEGA